jgi:hypothetical protein
MEQKVGREKVEAVSEAYTSLFAEVVYECREKNFRKPAKYCREKPCMTAATRILSVLERNLHLSPISPVITVTHHHDPI